MLKIILTRHGETLWNIQGRFQGRQDVPLSNLGVQQALALADALANIPIDFCCASPLQRARQTCALCAAKHNLPVRTDARLSEISHGDWEGLTALTVQQKFPREFRLWHSQPQAAVMPGGETLAQVSVRTRAAIDAYIREFINATLLITAHDAVNKVIICNILGLSLDHFWQIKQDNACINVLEYNANRWRLTLLNHTGHLGYLCSGVEQKGL